MASSNGPYESDMENEERTRWDRARKYRADDPQLSLEDEDEEDPNEYCESCGIVLDEELDLDTICRSCEEEENDEWEADNLDDDEDEPDDDTEDEDEED